MLKVRFKANEDDYRPIKWPVKYPYWCSGYGEGYSIVISFADDLDYIKENWPEASDMDSTEVESVSFSDRFPKPDWYKEESLTTASTGQRSKFLAQTTGGQNVY